jgi:signal transduction histidine kinase
MPDALVAHSFWKCRRIAATGFLAWSLSVLSCAPQKHQLEEGRVPALQSLEDAAGSLTLAEAEKSSSWTDLNGQPTFGYTSSAYWIRFRITSESPDLLLRVGHPILDSIKVFQLADGQIKEYHAGDRLPFAERPVLHRDFVFPLDAQGPQTVYVRVQSSSSMQVPVSLWTRKGFLEATGTENYILGIYFGSLGVMLLYNLFLYFSVRDTSYLFYVLYISAFALTMLNLNGMAYQFLWPASPLIENTSVLFLLFASGASAAGFSMSFLKTRQMTGWVHRVLTAIVALSLAAIILSPWLPMRLALTAFNLLMLVLVPSILLAAWRSLKNGYVPARYFLFAWAGFLAGILINALRTLGILPINPFTNNAMLCGSALEVVLLSLALGARIKVIRQERTDAQMLALSSIQRADRLQDELLSNVSHELNTPLASILAHAEMLQNGDWAAEELANVYATIRSDSAKLSRQVNNLMLVTKIGAQSLTTAPQECDLLRIMKQAAEAVAVEHPGRIVSVEECTLHAHTDGMLLQKALHEIVLNGVLYSGPEAFVRVRACRSGPMIEIEVTDNGPGIPDHAIDIVTGRFARMDQAITYRESGIGMGLFLATRLAEILHGTLTLENDLNGGLRARFQLPGGP